MKDNHDADRICELFNEIESLLNAGDHKKALKTAWHAIECFPNCGFLYAALGEVHFVMKNVDRAIPEYETAIALGVDSTPVLNNLGLCFLIKHDFKRAIYLLSEAIATGIEDENPFRARARAYRAVGYFDLAFSDERKADEIKKRRLNTEAQKIDLVVFRDDREILRKHGKEALAELVVRRLTRDN